METSGKSLPPWGRWRGASRDGRSSPRASAYQSPPDSSGSQLAPASWLSLWESWHLRSKWL